MYPIQIKEISEKNLKELLLGESFISSHKFNDNTKYLFFYKNKVYGIYSYLKTSQKKHLFHHNGYHPCYYYASNKLDIRLAHYLIRQENKKNIPISIIINKIDNKTLEILWHSLYNKSLISKELIPIDSSIQNILDHYDNIQVSKMTSSLYKQLQNQGKYLYNHLPKELKRELDISTSLILNGNASSFFYFLYDGESFISNRKKIKEHSYLSTVPSPYKKIKNKINYQVILNQYKHDVYMKKEFQNIKAQFKKVNIPLSYRFSKLNKNDLSLHLESCHFLHYIGHASDQGLLLDKDTYFSIQDIHNLSTVPKVLILSSCYGASKEFRDIYFKQGGQLLIYFDNLIDSQYMDYLFYSFYWQFFFRRSKIEEIILSLRRKSRSMNTNWLYLRVMGNSSIYYKGN